jgi:hypothetical protein
MYVKKAIEIAAQMTVAAILTTFPTHAQNTLSYAQRLGWKQDDKVIIFHVDDVGMSKESNTGTIRALAGGVATSASVMMPCPWTSDFADDLSRDPEQDIGLHLTLTSEWKGYRWGPLSGAAAVPGLVDRQGNFWNNVPDVVTFATPREVEQELNEQIKKAKMIGIKPTHLDTHMGVLWSSPAYLDVFVRTAIKAHIPALVPAGHLDWVEKSLHNSPLAGLKKLAPADSPDSIVLDKLRKTGEKLWAAGLPVVDDLHLLSYDWLPDSDSVLADTYLENFKTEKFRQLLQSLKPGITVILIHCSDTGEHFKDISDSGNTRRADLLAMQSQELKEFIKHHGFITTSWKELERRRDSVKH